VFHKTWIISWPAERLSGFRLHGVAAAADNDDDDDDNNNNNNNNNDKKTLINSANEQKQQYEFGRKTVFLRNPKMRIEPVEQVTLSSARDGYILLHPVGATR
jgi:hypothetical protein